MSSSCTYNCDVFSVEVTSDMPFKLSKKKSDVISTYPFFSSPFLIFCFVGDLVGCELYEMDQKERKEKKKKIISSFLDDCIVWKPVSISIFLSSSEIPKKRLPSS